MKTNATYAERVKQAPNLSSTSQIRQQNKWDAENSFVVNKIRNLNDARDSSSNKTALSHDFPRTKFLHTFKTADGRIIVETEKENTAREIIQNWPETLSGSSECSETKAKRPLNLILKGVALPDHLLDTGVDEKIYRKNFQNKSQEVS